MGGARRRFFLIWGGIWGAGTGQATGSARRMWFNGCVADTKDEKTLLTIGEAAELAGVEPPEDIDSDSFAMTLQGQPREKQWSRNSTMYWEFYERGSAQAVRFGKWKAIRRPMFTGKIELYDMSNDAGEKTNYAERRPDLVQHAEKLLDDAHEPDPNWKAPRKKSRK